MFTLGSIQWPENRSTAVHLYLGCLISVLDALGISFTRPEDDPVRITKQFLDGLLSDDERAKAAAKWWNYIDKRGAIREFQDKDILMGRLAICLLSITEKDAEQLGENLSWFLEVLGFLGENVDKAIEMMEVYFKPRN